MSRQPEIAIPMPAADSLPPHAPDEAAFRRRVLIILSLASLFVAGFLWLGFAPNTLFLIFAAIWFGCVLNHAARFVTRWTHLASPWSMTLVVAVLLALVVGFFVLLGFQIADRINELANNLQQASQELLRQIEQKFPHIRQLWQSTSAREAAQFVMQGPSGSSVAAWLATPLGFAVNVLFIFFTGLYLALSPRMYRDGLVCLFPEKHQSRLRGIFDEMGVSLWRWTLARLTAMIIVGVFSWIGLELLGVPLAPTLAILTALFDFIPNVGPLMALIPPMLLAFSEGPMVPVYVLLLYTGIQLVEAYLITPLIHEHENNLPAALIIIAQLVLGFLFGILGIIFAMPILLVAKIAVQRLYINR